MKKGLNKMEIKFIRKAMVFNPDAPEKTCFNPSKKSKIIDSLEQKGIVKPDKFLGCKVFSFTNTGLLIAKMLPKGAIL